MSVTVIIPTRDRPALLARALASVRAQTRCPEQVIVVNNGHDSIQIDGVEVVDVPAGVGACIARNVGAARARGEWLAFLDDDDRWEPEYLEEAEGLSPGVELVLTAFQKVRASGETSPEKVPPLSLDVRALLVRNQGLRGSNLFIRRDRLLGIRGFDEALAAAQDLDLAVRLADAGVTHRINPEPRVIFDAHVGPRISSPGRMNAFGNRAYLSRHGRRMTEAQVSAFRARTLRLFDTDPGPVPTLVWVLGPSGAGKSSLAHRLADREGARVLELASLLEWRDGACTGVAEAKRDLVNGIRQVELQRPPTDRRLFVVGARLPPGALRPLAPREHVIALVPRREDWLERLYGRDGDVSASHEADYGWWVDSFGVGVEAALRAALEAA